MQRGAKREEEEGREFQADSVLRGDLRGWSHNPEITG